jgi:hypothetical protein
MYFPWNWEFSSALSKVRNFGWEFDLKPPPPICHWLCGPCSSCSSPLINFGTAPFMLANGSWIMSTPRWCSCVCSHDCWCRILPLTEHHQGMNFGSRALYFLEHVGTVNTCIFFLPVVNSCTIWTWYDRICRSLFRTSHAVLFRKPHYLLNCLVDFGGFTKNAFCVQAVLPTYLFWTTTVPFVIVTEPVFMNFSDRKWVMNHGGESQLKWSWCLLPMMRGKLVEHHPNCILHFAP